ncbi:MAG: efflux RND transporter periplasmic adaptor subunit [Anaerolineales bacterium]|nr:efflux RND transporter periplasmic adaptor subunit [Anaerolineales bacterium]
MLKKKSFWIILFVIIIVAGGGYYYSTQIMPTEAAEVEEPAMQTAVARQGELTIFASGAGQLIPASEIDLGFDESGTLIELNAAVGDKVEAGDVLAQLQTKDSVESIEASIADAELAVLKAQNAIDDLYANAEIARTQALSDIAEYAQQVRDARYQMENYNMPVTLQGMDAIEALDLMKAELDAASAAFEPYRYYPSSDDKRADLLEDLNNAQYNYDSAVKRLDYEYVLEVAEANLDKVRQEYDEYTEGPSPSEVKLAEAELANTEAKLALAQEAQAVIDLVSPTDGTVMVVSATEGELIGTTAIITLANLEQPLLEVYLDETDLDKVANGYTADIVFDALPDNTFTGQVIAVNPSLAEVSGVQAIQVTVRLDEGSLESWEVMPIGLNASVDIIAGRAENAVLVPVEALRELGPDEYAVFVVEDGEPKLRVVTVGLVDITSAEILSGLQAGEIVTTGIVQAE